MGSRKCRQKIRFREFVLQENLSWKGGGCSLIRGLEIFQKKGGLTRKGGDKNGGGVVTLKKTMVY